MPFMTQPLVMMSRGKSGTCLAILPTTPTVQRVFPYVG